MLKQTLPNWATEDMKIHLLSREIPKPNNEPKLRQQREKKEVLRACPNFEVAHAVREGGHFTVVQLANTQSKPLIGAMPEAI